MAASAPAGASDLADTARAVTPGDSLRVEGLRLDGETTLTGLELKPFDVLAAGARIVAETAGGPRTLAPAVPVYLRGTVDGRPGSIAVISVRASGEIRGVVSTTAGTWLLGSSNRTAGRLASSKVDPASLDRTHEFSCEVRENPGRRSGAPASLPPAAGARPAMQLPVAYTARIALELDYEYFSTFGTDADAAVLYALDLIAFTGSLTESELGMNVLVPFVHLWTTASDPYSGNSGRLDQLRLWWNSNDPTHCGGVACSSIARTTTLYLSSALTGGVAYLPGVCDWYGSPLNGYSYAYGGSIAGDFDIASPHVVWDIVVASHELGHNFGSTHTHCFDPPIDKCYGTEIGCYSGATSLPDACPGPGQACGTLMSYCHLLVGGIENISLTYGTGHPYGVATNRVPDAMTTELAQQYVATPQCLAPVGGMKELAIDKTGSGRGVVTTVPAKIDCGPDCRGYFDGGDVVQLVAAPGTFSSFAGWSGDPDCADGQVTLSSNVSCTATFNGNCGAGADDCDDDDICTQDTCVAGDHCVNAQAPEDASLCFAAGHSSLQITNSSTFAADRLIWNWSKGDPFAQIDLGSPLLETTYTLCVYDSSAATSRLALEMTIPPSPALWQDRSPRGWRYKDLTGSASGVRRMQLNTGTAARTKVKLMARGFALTLPAPFSESEFFDEDPRVAVQLIGSDGRCWTSEFLPPHTGLNTPRGFKTAAP